MVDASADPFHTQALRERVLAAWAASPARFREDANAEEDLVRGGYRDRVVVELAQNAADAAARARVPGRLRLVLDGRTLRAANTGAPLDAVGVESLSTLRASAKRHGDTVGRFGVGFAAVLAVCDEPHVVSTTGAVRWSRPLALACARDLASLHAELTRRGEDVPVLRLPFAADASPSDGPPDGFATEVVLPLRDDAARALVAELLAGVDAALLLTLPALQSVEVAIDGSTRVLTAHRTGDGLEVDGLRWRAATASGRLDPALLADRPVEERAWTVWSVTWAAPETGTLPPTVPPVVHAPTPTDEPLGLPALLVASLPLDVSRRHVAPGPLTDFVVAQAGAAYADLLRTVPDPLPLVPIEPPAGPLDAALRRALATTLPGAPVLPGAADPPARVRPRDALLVEVPELVPVLAEVIPGLLPAAYARPAVSAALAALGVRRLDLADVVDLLAGLRRPPAWWRTLYAALDAVVSPGAPREVLAALPVPLASGEMATGPRGLVLPGGPVDLSGLGLRAVHPDAAHPLLAALGAVAATPRALLEEPRVREAVAASYDADDPTPVAEAVLGLVRAAGARPNELPWLADLALPDEDGEWAVAGELLLSDGPLAAVVAADAPFRVVHPGWVARWGADVLEAAGVLRTFALLRDTDVPAEAAAADHDLGDEEEWLAGLPGEDVPGLLPELVAVRDLELVADWSGALALLAGDPELRAAVVQPARVLLPSGRLVPAASYTAWWLSRAPVLGGRRPRQLRLPGADSRLAGLWDEAAGSGLDREFLRAVGVRERLVDVAPGEVLERLADVRRTVGRAQLRALMAWVATADPAAVDPPERVRAVREGALVVVPAAEAVVVDAPDLLPLVATRRAVVPCPLSLARALADVLDLPLAAELGPFPVPPDGVEAPVPSAVAVVLPHAPATWVRHPAGSPWRVVDGVVHAGDPDGLARGLAWAAGRWVDRHLVAAVLRNPDGLAAVLAEADLDLT